MTKLHHLQGRWVLSPRGGEKRGDLAVYQDKRGRWLTNDYATQDDEPVEVICQEGHADFDVVGNDDPDNVVIAIIGGEGFQPFLPDPGECERVGMPIDWLKDHPEWTA